MIPKSELRDGAYYVGAHRCSKLALWDLRRNEFIYLGYSMGLYGQDTAKHPEDDDGFALFVPFRQVDVSLTDAECVLAGTYAVKKKREVVELIGSCLCDPRKLSLYRLPNGQLEWLPDSQVTLVKEEVK